VAQRSLDWENTKQLRCCHGDAEVWIPAERGEVWSPLCNDATLDATTHTPTLLADSHQHPAQMFHECNSKRTVAHLLANTAAQEEAVQYVDYEEQPETEAGGGESAAGCAMLHTTTDCALSLSYLHR
jgi:hypothetical protein